MNPAKVEYHRALGEHLDYLDAKLTELMNRLYLSTDKQEQEGAVHEFLQLTQMRRHLLAAITRAITASLGAEIPRHDGFRATTWSALPDGPDIVLEFGSETLPGPRVKVRLVRPEGERVVRALQHLQRHHRAFADTGRSLTLGVPGLPPEPGFRDPPGHDRDPDPAPAVPEGARPPR